MLLKCLQVLSVAVLVAALPAAAQDAVIRGTVTSDRGEAVQVASVQVTELGVQAYTGATGQYVIQVPGARVRGQNVTLRVRSIGHKPAVKTLMLSAGEQTFDFVLATDVNMLEAIVVTGVQEATERAKVPFNVTRVDAEALAVQAVDPLRMLQGKIGANIVSGSGRPGVAPSVLLRGPTSLNAAGRSQDPLYIVDGVIINGQLPEISPNDIESVEVVKGAAAASLYGARAGNGVITITTKSGRRSLEGVKFTVRSEGGMSDIESDFGLAHRHALITDETGLRFCRTDNVGGVNQPTCARTFDYLSEARRINNAPGFFPTPAPGLPVDPGSNLTGTPLRQRYQLQAWPGTSYNAVAQTVTPNPFASNSVDLTGRMGTGTRFYASATNLSEQGAIAFLKGFDRNSFRATVDQVVGTQWNINVTAAYTRTSNDGQNNDGGNNAFFVLTRQPAIVNMFQRDSLDRLFIRPNLQIGGSQNSNPLYAFENDTRDDVANRFIGGVRVQFTPVQWLTLDGNAGYDLRRSAFVRVQDKGYRTTTSVPATNNGFINRGNTGDESFNASFNVSARHSLASDLIGRVSVRYLFEQRDAEDNQGQGRFLSVAGVNSLDNVTQQLTVGSVFTRVRQIGQFLGAGLDFKDRYILDGLIRRDGSSLFGVDNRWATFGRVSGTWLVGREPWWGVDQVSDLKLRASYGTAGSSPRFTAQYESFNIGLGGILTLTTLGNRNLAPEVNKEIELGVDIELFGKYGISATYARANIDRQILQPPVPSSTGYQNQWQNAGALLNITHELTINLPLISKRDLTWSMSLVYDHNRSWIKRLDVAPYFYGPNQQGATAMFQAIEGERVGTFYGRYFLRSCHELPSTFQSQCGGGNSAFQLNDEGYLVWVGAGNNPRMGVTDNLWETRLDGCINAAGVPEAVCTNFQTAQSVTAPWGVGLNWGMPIILRGSPTGALTDGINVPLGNALPDFRFAVTQTFTWKKLSFYALVDAAIGHQVWNEGYHWAHLDFLSKDVDQIGKPVETAKPIGYYYRAGAPDATGMGGFYDILGPNSHTVESASYAKLREVSLSYQVGRLAGVGDWSLSVSGRNLLTITGYRGFDPEVGIAGNQNDQSGGSRAINAVDAFVFPNLRSVTVRLATSF